MVVGGGEVATRKVQGLLDAGAVVVVVSPTLTEALTTLVEIGAIHHVARPFQAHDVVGCALVIGATDGPAVNAAVCEAARQRGIWVNIVDTPEACDFIAPAVVRRGALQIAISTGGHSPALAKHIREDLERRYGPEYVELLAWLGEQRQRIRQQVRDPAARKAYNQQLVDTCVRSRRAKHDPYLSSPLVGEDAGGRESRASSHPHPHPPPSRGRGSPDICVA
jgi:precorrin-2 dehydrogenase/sirohydrochlorin ferrochelatase